MRPIVIFLLIVLSSVELFAQNIGDYRTKVPGPNNWNSSGSWQIFNGTNWVNATTFPGQNAGTYNALVRSGHVILNPNTPNNFGALTIDGTLRLTNNNNYTLSLSSIEVSENKGIIKFMGNNNLIFPANTVLTVYPGSLETDKNCTASQRIQIGSIVFASCNGGGPNNPIPFHELELVNGSLLGIINSNFPDCSGDSVATLISSFVGLAGNNQSFEWQITAPDLTQINASTSPYNLDLSQNGDYIIKLTYSTFYNGSNTPYVNSRTIVYNNKVTTWNGTSWSDLIPDINTRVLINGKYTGPSFSACSLRISADGELIIPSNQFVEVDGAIINEGIFEVRNNGSLIQNMDVTNVGNIKYERIANNVHRFDYVYWSSPVNNFNISNIVGAGNRFFWNPLFNNANGTQGNWISFPSGVMDAGKGYIVRAPNNYPVQGQAPSTIQTNFIGVPNNGTFNLPVSRGNNTSNIYDNNNLVGNPYPSAINIESFLIENASNNNIIEGVVRLWTHGDAPSAAVSSPFYENFSSNYNVNDYLAINLTGVVSGPQPITTIGAGQGFFVTMTEGPQTTKNIEFNNSMRTKLSNDVFFRNANDNHQDKHRIWLDLVDADLNASRTLIGYINGASNEKDALYDASHAVDANSLNIYSHINQEDLLIQGRALPFNEQDIVAIGVNVPQEGMFSIAIGDADGIFGNSNQNIYIQDLELGVTHDLRLSPYEVFLNQGNHKDRFVLRYASERLTVSDVNSNSNEIVITSQPEGIKIKSVDETIHSVNVYNILGQKITAVYNVNSYELALNKNAQSEQVSIVNITLSNGQIVNRKIVF